MMTQQEILDLLETLVPGDYIEQLKPARLYLNMTAGAGDYVVDETVTSSGNQWRVWAWDNVGKYLTVTPLSMPLRPYVAGDVIVGAAATWTVQSVRGYKESGPGYELFQSYAKQMERASIAGAVATDSLFIEGGVGASKAVGTISLERTPHAANDCRVTYYAGTKFSTTKAVVRPGGWSDTLAVNDYELLTDVTFAPGASGPTTVAVRSTKYGYQQNVEAGTVTYPHEAIPEVAPGYIMMLGGVVGVFEVNEIVIGQTNGARFRVYGWHAGTGALVVIPTSTNIQIDVGEVFANAPATHSGTVLASYRYLDEFNDLTVTNAAAMTGGTWPSLDAIGDERGIYRQNGIPDRETWTMAAGGSSTYLVGELVFGRTYRMTMANASGAADYTVGENLTAPLAPGALWTVVSWEPSTLTIVMSDAGNSPPQTGDTLTGVTSGAVYEIAAQDPVTLAQWKVIAWDLASRVLQVGASIPGARFVPWQVLTGQRSGAMWTTAASTSYTAGGSESDDDYRDRIKTDLDVVSKPGLLRTIVRKIVTLGYRYAQLIEGWTIGCFLSETDGRTFQMDAGGTSNYVVGNTVTATSGGTGIVRCWTPTTRVLTIQPTNAMPINIGDHLIDGAIDWTVASEQPTGYPSTRDVYVNAGAGNYLTTDDVTNGLGATWHVELWDPTANMLRLSPVNGVDIADGDTLTGSVSGTARVINHQNIVIGADDGRTAIAWDITDIGVPGPDPAEPWVGETRYYGSAYDLTGWVILDNAEMRGSFCVVLPDIPAPNDYVYPAIYDAIVRMKAAGVLFAAMYKDGSINPIISFPVPVVTPIPVYPSP